MRRILIWANENDSVRDVTRKNKNWLKPGHMNGIEEEEEPEEPKGEMVAEDLKVRMYSAASGATELRLQLGLHVKYHFPVVYNFTYIKRAHQIRQPDSLCQ